MKYIVNNSEQIKEYLRKKEENAPPPRNFEEILESLGGFGKFQVLVMFLYLLLEIPLGFAIFIPIFIGRSPKLWLCNGTLVSNSDVCNCNGSIEGVAEDSFVSEWQLVCDKVWISDFITSIQMSGLLLGSIIGSQIADWYGRKSGFLFSILLLVMGAATSAIAPNPYVFGVSRFLSGAGIQAFINVTGAGVMEFMPPKYRSLANCIGPLGEGIMILSVMAYFIRPWRTLCWITAVPFAAIVLIYPFLPESPRWLMRQNRIVEAHAVLNYLAKVNGKRQININILKAIADSEQKNLHLPDDTITESKHCQPGYSAFICNPKLRKTSLFVMAIWFAWSLTYYGVSFNLKNMEGLVYINVFLMGLANALGQRATLLTNDRLGRRTSLFLSMSCGSLFMVIAAILFLSLGVHGVSGSYILILSLLSLFGMSATRSTSKLVTGESFPTDVRAMSFGISGIAIMIGGALSPQLALLAIYFPSAPFFVLAAVSLCGSLVSFLMKETMGTNLDEAAEGEKKSSDSGSPMKGVQIL